MRLHDTVSMVVIGLLAIMAVAILVSLMHGMLRDELALWSEGAPFCPEFEVTGWVTLAFLVLSPVIHFVGLRRRRSGGMVALCGWAWVLWYVLFWSFGPVSLRAPAWPLIAIVAAPLALAGLNLFAGLRSPAKWRRAGLTVVVGSGALLFSVAAFELTMPAWVQGYRRLHQAGAALGQRDYARAIEMASAALASLPVSAHERAAYLCRSHAEAARNERLAADVNFAAACALAASTSPVPHGRSSPVAGHSWTVPELGLELVWIAPLGMWTGKYEVTNAQYRQMRPDYDSGEFRGHSLNGNDQPAVNLSFQQAAEFAGWLSARERRAGRLPPWYCYRLPTGDEWAACARCGDDRKYPWGNAWPPTCGNYGDEEAGKAFGLPGIAGYHDGSLVTCPVAQSGGNEWSIYGLGGNAWECTLSDDREPWRLAGWRGGCWLFNDPPALTIDRRYAFDAGPKREGIFGFRLVLARRQTADFP